MVHGAAARPNPRLAGNGRELATHRHGTLWHVCPVSVKTVLSCVAPTPVHNTDAPSPKSHPWQQEDEVHPGTGPRGELLSTENPGRGAPSLLKALCSPGPLSPCAGGRPLGRLPAFSGTHSCMLGGRAGVLPRAGPGSEDPESQAMGHADKGQAPPWTAPEGCTHPPAPLLVTPEPPQPLPPHRGLCSRDRALSDALRCLRMPCGTAAHSYFETNTPHTVHLPQS